VDCAWENRKGSSAAPIVAMLFLSAFISANFLVQELNNKNIVKQKSSTYKCLQDKKFNRFINFKV
jgi:hypothetical protein